MCVYVGGWVRSCNRVGQSRYNCFMCVGGCVCVDAWMAGWVSGLVGGGKEHLGWMGMRVCACARLWVGGWVFVSLCCQHHCLILQSLISEGTCLCGWVSG